MADNYLENQREAIAARVAKRERERKKRQHRYLERYRKELAAKKALEAQQQENKETE